MSSLTPRKRRVSARVDRALGALHAGAKLFDRLPVSPHGVGKALLESHLKRLQVPRENKPRTYGAEQALTWEELVTSLGSGREAEPRWVRAGRTLREWQLGRLTWRVRMAAQLAARGWCDQDAWNLDHVLCTRLAAQLDSLADQLHGWPGNEEFPTPEDWEKALRSTAADLRRVYGSAETQQAADAWVASPAGETETSAYERWAALDTADSEAVTRALHWVADHHQHLWD